MLAVCSVLENASDVNSRSPCTMVVGRLHSSHETSPTMTSAVVLTVSSIVRRENAKIETQLATPNPKACSEVASDI